MSEGHASAQRINRASLTPDPYLLHRVDASQLQTPVRVVNGAVEDRKGHTCAPQPAQKPSLWKSWRW